LGEKRIIIFIFIIFIIIIIITGVSMVGHACRRLRRRRRHLQKRIFIESVVLQRRRALVFLGEIKEEGKAAKRDF
tara:strand:+ start:515 stop:739 length:225 start_codon:yes stop_codon:yes gene_type:complete